MLTPHLVTTANADDFDVVQEVVQAGGALKAAREHAEQCQLRFDSAVAEFTVRRLVPAA